MHQHFNIISTKREGPSGLIQAVLGETCVSEV